MCLSRQQGLFPPSQELINIAKHPKQQGLNIFLEPGINNDMEKVSWFFLVMGFGLFFPRQAKRVLTRIEFTTLRHVTTLVEIIYDPNPADTVVEEDKCGGVGFDTIPSFHTTSSERVANMFAQHSRDYFGCLRWFCSNHGFKK